MPETTTATAAGTIDIGGDLTVQRMGFGATTPSATDLSLPEALKLLSMRW